MAGSDDIRRMSDPDFQGERTRVRETIGALTGRPAEVSEEDDHGRRVSEER
jgi:hypothetical protein